MIKAELKKVSNDLFWTACSPEFEMLRWCGYNDGNWWSNVANSDEFRICTAKDGTRYRLDPWHCTVTEEAKAAA